MESLRWLVLSPLVVAIAAGALGPGRQVGALGAEAAWDPPPCTPGGAAPPDTAAWYRLDPVLDRSGTLAARRLTVGIAGAAAKVADLAPESFASGPVAGVVLAGSDDGSVSRLRLLDPERGCATAVADEAAVIRSAVLAADGRSTYEHRVDRATRADLGVWHRPAGGAAVRVLAGLAADPRLGPTFVTDLLLAADGRLTVSSCTPAGCRVRVLDPATGAVVTARGTGPALGVTGDTLVVRDACAGLPCPIVAVQLATGRRSLLVGDAWTATLGGPAGGTLVYEVAAGRVASLDIATGRRLAPVEAGGIPLRAGSTANAGAAMPLGAVALAPDGRPGPWSIRRFDPSTGRSSSQPEGAR
jgi:hypothetical protein